MGTIQTSSALKIARLDLTTNNNTTLYTVPSRYDAIVESIIISEDSGNADSFTVTITDSASAVFGLFVDFLTISLARYFSNRCHYMQPICSCCLYF